MDEQAAVILKPHEQWLDTAAIAAMLSVSRRTVRERIALSEGFPTPIRLLGPGFPRWNRAEVEEWVEQQRQRKVGRDRR